jgi:predicted outer membrane repeat protein
MMYHYTQLTVILCCYFSSTGGAIYTFDDTTTTVAITQSTFTGNACTTGAGAGGACYISGTTFTMHNSTFSHNTAVSGGSLLTTANTTITNSYFSDNSANGSSTSTKGGAVVCYSKLDVNDTVFTNNYSSLDGGAISIVGATGANITAVKCSFTSNTAARSGGAVYNEVAGAQFNASTFLNNTANEGGMLQYMHTIFL